MSFCSGGVRCPDRAGCDAATRFEPFRTCPPLAETTQLVPVLPARRKATHCGAWVVSDGFGAMIGRLPHCHAPAPNAPSPAKSLRRAAARVTGLALLAYITAALLAQITVMALIAAFRYGQAHGQRADDDAGQPLAKNAAWRGTRRFLVRSRASEDRAGSQVSFYLEPVDGQPLLAYEPGQFLTFQIDLPDTLGVVQTLTRCYSLSDRPDPTAYRITVKRAAPPADRRDLPPGLVSGYLHDTAIAGMILQVRAPAGVFVMDDDATAPFVLIAGGIGITPLFAMARGALARQPKRTIHLFYGVRDASEIVFGADLAAMQAQHPGFHVMIVESCPMPGDSGGNFPHVKGYIDIALLSRTLPGGCHPVYLCGPPAMMAALIPALHAWGVARDDLHYEAFGSALIGMAGTPEAVVLETPLAVQFARSERSIDWTGEDSNLLDFAERHGIDLPSGCRAGRCGTCETMIASGAVRYVQPPAFDVAPGHCLPCIAAPTEALVLGA